MWNTGFSFTILICCIALTVFGALLLLLKNQLRRHISPHGQYHLWFFFLFVLTLPLIPVNWVHWTALRNLSMLRDLSGLSSLNRQTADASVSLGQADSLHWIQDFTLSVNSQLPAYLDLLVGAVWVLGALAMLAVTLHAALKIRKLEKSARLIENGPALEILEDCKKLLGIEREIHLCRTDYIHAPYAGGLLRPRIYIPDRFASTAGKTVAERSRTQKELRFIVLHELQHYRNKDVLINSLMCFFRIVYWFHPMVWYGLKSMKDDCEIACDASVLDILGEDCHGDYGHTLIDFAEGFSNSTLLSNPALYFTAGIGGSGKQIRKRIRSIAQHVPASKMSRRKTIAVFTLAGILTLSCSPFLSLCLSASESEFPNGDGSTLFFAADSAYFSEYEGSFASYDSAANQWTVYNRDQSVQRVSPNSTYKIYSALFALESGVITAENNMLPWNGSHAYYDSWNQDQTLDSAMKNSVTWYFLDLDRLTGFSQLKRYLNEIHYGNSDLSGGESRFWLESSLKISPVEQVSLLKDFYTNAFQFNRDNIETVKNAMRLTTTGSETLYGKTGTGSVDGHITNGWFVGFVESEDNVVYFATNIQAEDQAFGSTAADITLNILRDKGIYAK